jgi:peptidoglycan-N-acetylglucosamine deacetylase
MNIRQEVIHPAEFLGIILLPAAFIAFFLHPCLAVALLSFYVVLCLTASFLPGTNFLGPVISHGKTGQHIVALTFDDGPAEPLTREILSLLDKYSVPATFFVVGVKADCHPEIIKEMIVRGHTVGNHSFHHDPFLMLRGSKTIYREIIKTQETLRKIGVNTTAFRPPVGIINPQLAPILEKSGMYCITFSCRAVDAGNRRVKNISRKILKKVRPDDIILLHDSPPQRKEDEAILLSEIESVLAGLASKGLEVVPLSVLTGKEIMNKL